MKKVFKVYPWSWHTAVLLGLVKFPGQSNQISKVLLLWFTNEVSLDRPVLSFLPSISGSQPRLHFCSPTLWTEVMCRYVVSDSRFPPVRLWTGAPQWDSMHPSHSQRPRACSLGGWHSSKTRPLTMYSTKHLLWIYNRARHCCWAACTERPSCPLVSFPLQFK